MFVPIQVDNFDLVTDIATRSKISCRSKVGYIDRHTETKGLTARVLKNLTGSPLVSTRDFMSVIITAILPVAVDV
jgi:hypothetical protein